MKGFASPPRPSDEVGQLNRWESLVADAVGAVIEFWGFKQNQGRVWALLYLRGSAMSAQDLQEELGLSKGAVSMLTRELETWGVVHRVRSQSRGVWLFEAETDLMRMVGRVIQQREAGLLRTVKDAFAEALYEAKRDPDVDAAVLERLRRLKNMAEMVERAVDLFLKTARLDVHDAFEVLDEEQVPSERPADEAR